MVWLFLQPPRLSSFLPCLAVHYPSLPLLFSLQPDGGPRQIPVRRFRFYSLFFNCNEVLMVSVSLRVSLGGL